jgi:CheY-like chemotaxis protein
VKNGYLLHIEDDEDDVIFLALAFEDVGITNSIQVVRDGQEALDYFKSIIERSQRVQASLPALILLDLKLPRVNGLEVLRWLRQQPALRELPVLVLTASDHPADLEQARELGANAYFIKPSNLDDRKTFAQRVKLWLLQQGDLPNSPSWRIK